MKNKIKIKLECWWTDSGSLTMRFLKQFVSKDDLELFEFTQSDPDYTIIFGKTDWSNLSTPKERTFYFSQEPSWSPNQPKTELEIFCSKIFVSDKTKYTDRDEFIEIFLPMFYGGRGDLDHRDEWDWSQTMFRKDYSSEKTEIISSVVTNSWNCHLNYLSDPERSRIIYKERMDLTNLICEKLPSVKLWGSFQPNDNSNKMGTAWNKLVALRDFKFSICFENTIQKNYVSEKFWDCILTDTVPIYFGCSNINDYIEKDTFFNLTGQIDNTEYVLSTIKSILDNSEEIYKDYAPRIKKLKLDFTTKKEFNLWEKIKSELN